MPVITVNLWEEVLNEETEAQVIARFTEAIVDVLGESARPFTTVMIVSVPQRRWGVGGVVTHELEDLPRRRDKIRAMLQKSTNAEPTR